jgi:hypothetical protein
MLAPDYAENGVLYDFPSGTTIRATKAPASFP